MNKNNFFVIICIFLFSNLLLSSCKNLPGKGKDTIIEKAERKADDSSENEINTENDEQIFFNAGSEPWSAPSPDQPTVTPIVLPIEKIGEQAPMIIREVNDTIIRDNNFDNNNQGYYEQVSTPVPTAIQGMMQNGLYDGLEAVGFNPRRGSTVLPGQSLHLDVTLKNTGTTTWQTNYKISDISASPMAVTREYNLPYPVAPGGTVLLSIYLAAPDNLGNYVESFEIKDAYGVVFGNFDYGLTVGDFSVITAIPTLTATITPTYYSADGITATPDSLAWMCIDPERSKLQDCYSFCVEYSDREEFRYCFYDGVRYVTPVP